MVNCGIYGNVENAETINLIVLILGFLVSYITLSMRIKSVNKNAMNAKLDSREFNIYKEDHKEIHNKEQQDITYIRKRVDAIFDRLAK